MGMIEDWSVQKKRNFFGFLTLLVCFIFAGAIFFAWLNSGRDLRKWHNKKLLPVVRDAGTFVDKLNHARRYEIAEYISEAENLRRRAVKLDYPDTKLGMRFSSAFMAYLNSLYKYVASKDKTNKMAKEIVEKRKKYKKLYDKLRKKIRKEYVE